MTNAPALEDAPSVPRGRRTDDARRVADVLRRVVTDGAPGGLLPPEGQLAAEYGVSRNAVRAALDLLRAEGLVERIQGTGTRVTRAALPHGIDALRGLAETFVGHGEVRNEVRLARMVAASAPVAARLEVALGSEVLCLERRRLVDGEPVSLDLTFVVPDLGEQLLGCDLAGSDVFVLLEQLAGQRLGGAELTIDASTADHSAAEQLGVAPGSPLLLLERLTRLEDGRPVDLEYLRLRGDRITLRGTARRLPPNLP
ncbi:GntR family transcriptional regulator [Nocardioides euryhalodurans]|uniref:GntR family transcriptional regulator n=1 Tax=Nocardioides euryhalodurans TaxID=2518370 RepID=A0A4P7GK89_9ACTN|nr:GntR family transcriptional regulator [Nocardioides euryhalodurans]QBR92187.1 GntR family transcriptional regulator [Nocardioides euryhalodurans]